MTIDDNSQLSAQQQHLDLIEFCIAEFDITQQENNEARSSKEKNRRDDDLKIVNMRKWPQNRIVNYELLGRIKKKFLTFYNDYMERLLLFQVDQINRFTCYLELDKIFENCSTSARTSLDSRILANKKKLIVDMKTYKSLTRNHELNWMKNATSLYPIKTIGDGNCLCHAVLNYIIGMQDINLSLRETLKTYMNSREVCEKFKERWMANRRANDRIHNIQTEENVLEREWNEIKRMELNSSENSNEQDKNNNSKSQATTASPSSQSQTQTTPSMLYLEDIHVFALANMLRRPIIVISLETIRNIQPIDLRGIYLPLLATEPCIRDPIVIGFHNYHFVPLVYALDNRGIRLNDEYRTIKYNDKYFHFDNVDFADYNQRQQQSVLDDYALYESSRSTSGSSSFGFIRKVESFFNILPLVFSYDLDRHMKIHYLTESESERQMDLLSSYLSLVHVEVDVVNELNRPLDLAKQDLATSKGERIMQNLLCCFLDRSTIKPKMSGLSLYMDYLNESLTPTSSPLSTPSSQRQTSVVNSKPSTTPYWYTEQLTSSSPAAVKCKNCNRLTSVDSRPTKYNGLCTECYQKQTQLEENNRYEEIYPDKVEQQYYLPSLEALKLDQSPRTAPLATSSSLTTTPVYNTRNNPSKFHTAPSPQQYQGGPTNWDDKNDHYSTNRNMQSDLLTSTRLCKNTECKQIIQSSILNPNDSLYCKSCLQRIEAQMAVNNNNLSLKHNILANNLAGKNSNKITTNLSYIRCGTCHQTILSNVGQYCPFCTRSLNPYISPSKTSTSTWNNSPTTTRTTDMIQIPVTYETSRDPHQTSSNISAYNDNRHDPRIRHQYYTHNGYN